MTGSGSALDSNTGSEFIVTLAWRSAEIAALASAGLLLLSLLVRRYYRFEARLNERVIATWRPLLTRVALEEGDSPALPRLPGYRLQQGDHVGGVAGRAAGLDGRRVQLARCGGRIRGHRATRLLP